MKNCVFLRNKSLIKMCLTSNCCFWLKHKSSNHYIAFSSENKINSSESGEKYAQITSTVYNESSPKHLKTNISVDFDMKGQQGIDFCILEVLFWIIDWHFALMMDLFLTNMQLIFISQNINWWTGVLWMEYLIFLSAVSTLRRHPFIHWWSINKHMM